MARRRASRPSSSASSFLISPPRALLAAKRCDTSSPAFFARATSSPGRVLLALELLHLGDERAPLGVERRQRVEFGVHAHAALGEAFADDIEMIADEGWVEHVSDRISKAPERCDTIAPLEVFLTMAARVRKAVFPAAGLGTRFLPATKAQPKEMLPLVDKPIIQYGVEEAVASGIDNIILVTGRGKNAIEDHFDVSVELETFLESRNKTDAARRGPPDLQPHQRRRTSARAKPLGLGHAVLVTRELVGDEPFAVVLADDVVDAEPAGLKQMVDVFDRVQGPVLAVERVPWDRVSSYGIVDIESESDGVYTVRDLVEKPKREDATSNLAIIGRYILTPDIFDELEITATRPDRRDPADQRHPAPAEEAPDLRLRDQGRPPRHRQQARVPEGGGVFRAEAAGSRGGVQGVPARVEALGQ